MERNLSRIHAEGRIGIAAAFVGYATTTAAVAHDVWTRFSLERAQLVDVDAVAAEPVAQAGAGAVVLGLVLLADDLRRRRK